MYFKIADSNDLRYYPYVEETIGNGTTTTTPSNTTSIGNTTTDNMSVTPTPVVNSTEETQDVNASTPTNTESPVTTTSATPDAANNTTDKKNNAPGFEIVPAIFGLLSVFYIVRKNR